MAKKAQYTLIFSDNTKSVNGTIRLAVLTQLSIISYRWGNLLMPVAFIAGEIAALNFHLQQLFKSVNHAKFKWAHLMLHEWHSLNLWFQYKIIQLDHTVPIGAWMKGGRPQGSSSDTPQHPWCCLKQRLCVYLGVDRWRIMRESPENLGLFFSF